MITMAVANKISSGKSTSAVCKMASRAWEGFMAVSLRF